MRPSMKLFATAMLVLMCLMSNELAGGGGGGGGVRVVEGRTCESQSHKFKGTCLSDTNCGNVCKTEGQFYGGKCRGLRRRCFCTKHC